MEKRIIGLDKLMKKYGSLAESVAGKSMERAVGASCKMVQGEARLMCPANDGELRRSIMTQVENHGDRIVGAVYTNKKYGANVEFGTGPKGEADHAGISPSAVPAYSQSPWWIHESMVDQKTAEQYHWFYIDTADGRFYQSYGQPAQPFMYPALKNNEERATRDIADDMAREIRKVCE